jgi:hypothetical protein
MIQYIPHCRYYVVKNQSIAGELMKRGFVLELLKKNNDGSGKNVFLFSNSEALINSINNILSNKD